MLFDVFFLILFLFAHSIIIHVSLAGVLAVGIEERRAGSFYNTFFPDFEGIDEIIAFSVDLESLEHWSELIQEGYVIILHVTEIENDFMIFYEHWFFDFAQIIVALLLLGFTVYVAWKLLKSLEYHDLFSILPISLGIEFISCICKIVLTILILQ